ncbi:MAG: hypothetical protein H6Q33_2483 [Deltaproteobacteria bacterium]|nr:hypothetical protein [Deltaproteobacteria bacterium]
MLTDAQTNETYERAFAALHSMANDNKLTEEQRSLARDERDRLNLEYIGKAVSGSDERTVLFQTFIDKMNNVITQFAGNDTVDGLRKLKSVVDLASEVLGAATKTFAAPAARVIKPVAKAARRGAVAKKTGKSSKKAGKTAKTSGKAAKQGSGTMARPSRSRGRAAPTIAAKAPSRKAKRRAR